MKITLMDIMESLNGENMEDAQAALHEWFVDQSKKVHAQLTTPVTEADDAEEVEETEEVDEARVDELSTDTMMAYAKRARKDRDSAVSDDDKVGRRVKGLGMAIDKAKRAHDAPKYESEVAEGSYDNMQDPELEAMYDAAYNYLESAQEQLYIPNADEHSIQEIQSLLGQAIIDCENYADLDAAWLNNLKTGIAAYSDEATAQTIVGELADEIGVSMVESFVESEEVEEETVEESVDDLIAELAESFKGLETVSDKLQNQEGAQVGEEGKVSVNTKATLPSHKGKDRVGGEPVAIKGKGHTGHALEKAPAVKDAPVKHHVQNSKDDPTKVPAEKSALLNKMDGSVNTQSPISGKGAKGLKK